VSSELPLTSREGKRKVRNESESESEEDNSDDEEVGPLVEDDEFIVGNTDRFDIEDEIDLDSAFLTDLLSDGKNDSAPEERVTGQGSEGEGKGKEPLEVDETWALRL